MTRRWLAVPGFEDRYKVSDDGQVHSLTTQRALSQAVETGPRGYRYVTLRRDGQQFHRRVHALVLDAFVGPRPVGLFGLHNDDDPTNNALGNLRWGTRSQNAHDSVANGTHNNARKTHCKHGHELTGDNLIVTAKQRSCRACKQRRQAEYDSRRRALAVLAADQIHGRPGVAA